MMPSLRHVSMLISLALLQQLTRCEIVSIKAISNDIRTDPVELCGIYRGPKSFLTSPGASFKYTPFTNFSPCTTNISYQLPAGSVSAIYFKLNQMECDFSRLETNLGNSFPIVAVNDSLKLILKNRTSIRPALFTPESLASALERLLGGSTNIDIEISQSQNPFDGSIIIVSIVSLLTLIVAALWNRHEFKKKVSNMERATITGDAIPAQADEKTKSTSHKFWHQIEVFKMSKVYSVLVPIILTVVFILTVVVLNLSYTPMEIVLSIVFTILSIFSMGRIGLHIMNRINLLTCKVPKNSLPLLKHRPEIRQLVFYAMCFAFCWLWFGVRFTSWSWILQDIMVASLVLNILSVVAFRSYKMCMLVLLFFLSYDIFMIFFLPLITKDYQINKSLCFGMQTLRYSRERNENLNTISFNVDDRNKNMLPFFFAIPIFNPDKKLCAWYSDFPYTILGMGEVIVPALSLNYAFIHDMSTIGTKIPVYFITNLLGLILGYFLASLCVALIAVNQPVLVFVLPIMVSITLPVAFIKKEFKDFWHGHKIKQYMITNSKK